MFDKKLTDEKKTLKILHDYGFRDLANVGIESISKSNNKTRLFKLVRNSIQDKPSLKVDIWNFSGKNNLSIMPIGDMLGDKKADDYVLSRLEVSNSDMVIIIEDYCKKKLS